MLNKTTTWPQAVKAEIRNGLNINCMSPEQSEEEDGGESQQSDSDEDGQESNKRKVIKVRALSWRSERFTNILSSLDRKYLRKIFERARSMMQERRAGETLVRHAPDDLPAWMVKR